MLNLLINIVNYPFRKLKSFLKKKLGWQGTPCIIVYRGFANSQDFYLRGRVVEDTGLAKPEEEHHFWDNLLAMIKRYGSSGISELPVRVDIGNKKYDCVSDEDGYFEINNPLPNLPDQFELWYPVQATLDKNENIRAQAESIGQLLVNNTPHSYGVITDIDDTILISHATNFRKKLKLMLFKNAKTRLPFDGASAFYRALYQGPNLEKNHPFFYVSSSEWNLYDLLVDFCEHHDFPKGPFLLRTANIQLNQLWKSGGGNHNHKHEKICRIFDMNKDLPFILVGDSGQHDAEIYRDVALQNPGRVLAIYIRDVRPSRHQAVLEISNQLADHDIEMLLVKDTEEAAIHALSNKFIHPDAVRDIIDEKQLNQEMDSELAQILEKITN